MKFKVTELSHEELVDLISTAFTGNNVMGITYNRGDYNDIPEEMRTPNPCIEDKCADILLAGGTITVADYEAEDYGLHGTRGRMVENDGWSNCGADKVGLYDISYLDILDACSHVACLPLVTSLFVDESGDFWDAYNLIQVATFGEIVYG